jgi:protease YdgD
VKRSCSKEESSSFLKKRTKKLFPVGVCHPRTTGLQWQKVFWFFFSKKNRFLPFFAVLPGVASTDPRQIISVDAAPFRGLVRVQTELGARCTGFLIAPAEVATAAHCLFIARTGHYVQPASVHVLLRYRKGAFAAHSIAVSYRIGPGYDPRNETATAGADWAVLTLARPIGTDGILPTSVASVGTAIVLAGYGKDREELADADLACTVTGITADGAHRRLLTHSCSATLGTSGAPLLVRAADGDWRIIGVQILARTQGGGGVAVPIAAITSPP